MTSKLRGIAKAFVDARREGTSLESYPGERPGNLRTAYAIQDAALSAWKRPVGGWKVGKINPPLDAELGANRLVGPAFDDQIVHADGTAREFGVFAGGFAAAEAEFMLRLTPRSGPLPTTPHEAMAWVDDVRIGIEIASSPYAAINIDGPCVTVSDHGNNHGLLIGPAVPREAWDGLNDVEVSLTINGDLAGKATTATMLDGPFGAVAFLLRNLDERGIVPQAGWWVSSGAITGVHEVTMGDRVTASFAGLGELDIAIAG